MNKEPTTPEIVSNDTNIARLAEITNELNTKLGALYSSWTETFQKTANSKNISIAEWNALVSYTSIACENAYTIRNAIINISEVIDDYDVDTISELRASLESLYETSSALSQELTAFKVHFDAELSEFKDTISGTVSTLSNNKLDRIVIDENGNGADPEWGSESYDHLNFSEGIYSEHQGSDGTWRTILHPAGGAALPGSTTSETRPHYFDRLKSKRIVMANNDGRVLGVAPDKTIYEGSASLNDTTINAANTLIPKHYADSNYAPKLGADATYDIAYTLKKNESTPTPRPVSTTHISGTASIPLRNSAGRFEVGDVGGANNGTTNYQALNARSLIANLGLVVDDEFKLSLIYKQLEKTGLPDTTGYVGGNALISQVDLPIESLFKDMEWRDSYNDNTGLDDAENGVPGLLVTLQSGATIFVALSSIADAVGSLTWDKIKLGDSFTFTEDWGALKKDPDTTFKTINTTGMSVQDLFTTALCKAIEGAEFPPSINILKDGSGAEYKDTTLYYEVGTSNVSVNFGVSAYLGYWEYGCAKYVDDVLTKCAKYDVGISAAHLQINRKLNNNSWTPATDPEGGPSKADLAWTSDRVYPVECHAKYTFNTIKEGDTTLTFCGLIYDSDVAGNKATFANRYPYNNLGEASKTAKTISNPKMSDASLGAKKVTYTIKGYYPVFYGHTKTKYENDTKSMDATKKGAYLRTAYNPRTALGTSEDTLSSEYVQSLVALRCGSSGNPSYTPKVYIMQAGTAVPNDMSRLEDVTVTHPDNSTSTYAVFVYNPKGGAYGDNTKIWFSDN